MQIRPHLPAVGLLLFLAHPAWAQLRVEPAEVDFGPRPQNQVFTVDAKITNTSDSIVKVMKIEADCGCTTGRLTAQQLAPGQSAGLTVRLETGAVEGAISHRLLLELSTGHIVTFPVKAIVYHYPDWTITPARLLLPPSAFGLEAAAELRLDYFGAGQPKIVSVEADSRWITVEALRGPARTFIYIVNKVPDAPVGSLFARIRVTTDDKASPLLDVPVFAYVAAGGEVSTPTPSH